MKILMSGNPTFGIASEFIKLYPETTFISRENGYDLTIMERSRKIWRNGYRNGCCYY